MSEAVTSTPDFAVQAAEFRTRFESIRSEVAKVIVGHDEIVYGVVSALMIGGHCLLEGSGAGQDAVGTYLGPSPRTGL